ncbi:unnamed protein product [Euphydryas editha]|uniref:Uncharacterized protein n=1 Tax=Euphydryas editha TaxID=104508 RepID=A0AAU9UWF7_EUPED|nr:unnamed protein product [Euphydryas editha]
MHIAYLPYFVATSDPENYYYSLLLQYVPYRNESEFIVNHDTAAEPFLARESHLRVTNTSLEMYRERDRQLENAFNQIHGFEILNQEAEQANIAEGKDARTPHD